MNKKLIAIAVASAMSVPAAVTVMAPTTAQADDSGPTVYGRLRAGLQRTDDDLADDDVIGFEDGSSRFGIRGEEDLGNGLAAIYRYEWATTVVEDEGSATGLGKRHSWVGLKGSFGQVTIGRQTNPFYGLTGTSYALGNEYTGNYAMYEVGNFSDKTSDSLVYRNSFGDLEFGAAFEFNQDDAANEDLDSFSLAGRYNFGAGRVSLAYWDQDVSSDDGSTTENDVFAAFVDFNIGESGNIYLGWMGAATDVGDTFDTDDGIDISIDDRDVDSYHIGYGGRSGDVSYFISYDGIDYDNDNGTTRGTTDRDIITIGGAYYLSSRTRIYFEAEFLDSDAEDADRNRQVVGLRHDF